MSYECYKLELDSIVTYFVVEGNTVYEVSKDSDGMVSTCSEKTNTDTPHEESTQISESDLPEDVHSEFERGASPL